VKVSVLILTHNEEVNLGTCLGALSWCDDILVLDSGSTDSTIEIAKSYGARVMTRAFDCFAGQRNYGLEMGSLRHDWVLHLDADEIVTPSFVEALEILQAPPTIDAYYVPSKLMLFGRWLRHAGMYPIYQVRIGRREKLRFKQVGHGQREDVPADRVSVFKEPYLHHSFSHGLRHWLQRHIRYAADEADLLLSQPREAELGRQVLWRVGSTQRRRAAKAFAARLPLFLRPPLRFCYLYFYHQGFRDGGAGLVYSLMMSVYEGMIAVLAYERLLNHVGDTPASSGP
jgi:glycosyltransferase involved in cell wall biosynthesis